MPGHMNVLLAEAQVPYEQLFDLDQINDQFAACDVALVVGANDVVNTAARENPSSPIYGMPIFNVDQARSCIVLKRTLNPGFAGIENGLFIKPNTMLVLGDAKKTLMQFTAGLKDGH
jgi:NAD(P) transhydrogenase subunit beta